jgi:hypothetical protein
MPLYTIGIIRSQDVPLAAASLAGWIGDDNLACAWIDAPHGQLTPMQHAAALDAIHRRVCVLPMRFGTAVDDEAELRSLLLSRRDEFLDGLCRIDGACEMGLRIVLSNGASVPADSCPTDPSPSAYLASRRSLYEGVDAVSRLANQTVEQLVEQLRDGYRVWRQLPSLSPDVVRLAFLVDRGGVEAFRRRLEQCEQSCVVLGPWPPYSFVG